MVHGTEFGSCWQLSTEGYGRPNTLILVLHPISGLGPHPGLFRTLPHPGHGSLSPFPVAQVGTMPKSGGGGSCELRFSPMGSHQSPQGAVSHWRLRAWALRASASLRASRRSRSHPRAPVGRRGGGEGFSAMGWHVGPSVKSEGNDDIMAGCKKHKKSNILGGPAVSS